MEDKRPFYILGFAAIVLVALFTIFGKSNTSFDWSENYEAESKDPYGSFVIHEMMKGYFPNNSFTEIKESIDGELPLSNDEKSNYVFVGESMFLDSADVATLFDFVREGNTAFISSKTIPFNLMFELYYEECNNESWDDYATFDDMSAGVNLLHPKLKIEKDFPLLYVTNESDGINSANYGWNYIDSAYFCDQPHSMIPLGTFTNNKINFAKKIYGPNGGSFYLHTAPLAFTNITMRSERALDYASKVFSHLYEGDVYWDEYSRVGEGFGRAYNRRAGGNGNRSIASEESLKYILAQPSLAWAWYLTIGLGLLYLFFRAKRKQRIIPVLEQNENTSFEFISTIGRLYFLQNDHKKLCQQKMKLFYAYIRNRYNLNTTNVDD